MVKNRIISDVSREVKALSEINDLPDSEKLDTLLYALGALFWYVGKDMKARGDLSDEDRSNMRQTANYLRLMSGKSPQWFEL